MIDRRGLLLGGVASALVGLSAAQPVAKSWRIGWFGYTARNTADDERLVAAFVQRLRELGFAEGANLLIEWRFAEGRNERYAEFAAEMVALKADLVVAGSGTAARAVMAASRTLPIIAFALPDPVRSGLVASLARPGGQLSGIYNLADELVPKRLELLKAAVPWARRIAFAHCAACSLTAGTSPEAVAATLRAEADAARSLGVQWLPVDVDAVSAFDAAAAVIRRERADALLIGATQINVALHDRWLAFAAEQRLPMMAPSRGFGALLSYGPDYAAVFRRTAEFAARVLRGANPGELPMEQPTVFELVVNLQVANALGITIPQSLLIRADEVIQ